MTTPPQHQQEQKQKQRQSSKSPFLSLRFPCQPNLSQTIENLYTGGRQDEHFGQSLLMLIWLKRTLMEPRLRKEGGRGRRLKERAKRSERKERRGKWWRAARGKIKTCSLPFSLCLPFLPSAPSSHAPSPRPLSARQRPFFPLFNLSTPRAATLDSFLELLPSYTRQAQKQPAVYIPSSLLPTGYVVYFQFKYIKGTSISCMKA